MRTFVLTILVAASAFGASDKSLAGTWQGQMRGLLTVTLSINTGGDKLSGTAIFYATRDDGGGPMVVGKAESPLIDPKFDGQTLSFQVENEVLSPLRPERYTFEMKLAGENEAELKPAGDQSEKISVKMTRQK